MLYALLVALVAVNVAYLVLLDRKDVRATSERAEQRAETQVLLQRIQAPREAVFEHSIKDAPPFAPKAARLDDDESFWQATEPSKDDLAEALARHELEAARVGA